MSTDHPVTPEADALPALLDLLPRAALLIRGERILYANAAFYAEFGYSPGALLDGSLGAILTPGGADRVLARCADAQAAGLEVGLMRGDQTTRRIDVTLSRLGPDADAAVLMSIIDVTEQRRAEANSRKLQQLLAQIIEGDPVATYIIDEDHVITHWNRACAHITGAPAAEMVGSSRQWAPFYATVRPTLADLIVDGDIDRLIDLYGEKKIRRSATVVNAYEAEDFFPHFGAEGRWLYFTAAPLRDVEGRIIGAIETLLDVTERHRAEMALLAAHEELEHLVERRTEQLARAKDELEADIARREATERELRSRNGELAQLNERLSMAQQQLMQSEKLASIGQLAAGVAHEINNPIGYVQANVGMLERYLGDLLGLLDAYKAAEERLEERPCGGTPGGDPSLCAGVLADLRARKQEIDLDFLREDIPALLGESREGIERVRRIVQDLKDFSRADNAQEWQHADLHAGLDSTLNIAANEIKYRADVIKEYGVLPQVECLPSQLNQVFMNLFVNAAQAIPDGQRGTVTVRTGCDGDTVWIEVRDNGCGIPGESVRRIFDPFFTTKPVGKGTGLGLSLSYGIVKKHGGSIEVDSEPGRGSCFRVVLPVHQRKGDAA